MLSETSILEILQEHIRETEDKILLLDYKKRSIKGAINTYDDNVKKHFELLLKYFESMRELYIIKLRLLELIYELSSNNLISEKEVKQILEKVNRLDISSEDISEIVTNILERLRSVMNNMNALRKLYETLRSYSSAELS